MGNIGLVTVKSGDQVLMKVVCGQDGQEAEQVAHALKELWPVSAERAHSIALGHGYGSMNCLIVITKDQTLYHGDDDTSEEREALIRRTFQDPEFNPRWKQGLSDFVEIVEV